LLRSDCTASHQHMTARFSEADLLARRFGIESQQVSAAWTIRWRSTRM
jgi:hypothetical protein